MINTRVTMFVLVERKRDPRGRDSDDGVRATIKTSVNPLIQLGFWGGLFRQSWLNYPNVLTKLRLHVTKPSTATLILDPFLQLTNL